MSEVQYKYQKYNTHYWQVVRAAYKDNQDRWQAKMMHQSVTRQNYIINARRKA